jgi:hypothetical protein
MALLSLPLCLAGVVLVAHPTFLFHGKALSTIGIIIGILQVGPPPLSAPVPVTMVQQALPQPMSDCALVEPYMREYEPNPTTGETSYIFTAMCYTHQRLPQPAPPASQGRGAVRPTRSLPLALQQQQCTSRLPPPGGERGFSIHMRAP